MTYIWIDNKKNKSQTINHTQKNTEIVFKEKNPKAVLKNKKSMVPITSNDPLTRIVAIQIANKTLKAKKRLGTQASHSC